MKTKLQSKFLSILLVLVMVLALVPVSALTAFAAGGAEWVDFAIKESWGIYFEQTGANKNYPIVLTNENKLSMPLPTLYRTDSDDYVFDGWYIADTDTKVTQDTVFDGYTVVVDRWTFQEKDANTVISNIKVNNVVLEAGMTTAEYNAAVQGATATVNGAPANAITADSAMTYTIYHGLNKSGDPLGAEDEVEVGQDYSVVTKIKLADGYTFSPNITFISDGGMCASEKFLGGADIFTKQWNTLATEIEMTINFMNTDYYFDQTPESRKLENYTQYKNWYTVSKLEGLESVTLQYESDGAWAVFIDNVPFEANGGQAGGYVTVSPYVDTTKTFRLVANYTQGKVYSEPFEVSWACLTPVIESVAIGVTEPMNGFAPQYTATTDSNRYTFKSENAETVKNGIKWTGDVAGELAVSGSKFNNDNDYTVSLKLVAQDGYTFANNVTATINANNANISVESETEIRISYTFPKPEKQKWYVHLSNAGSYASGTMQPVLVEEGEYTLPAPTYTPTTGYVFEGWLVGGLLKQPGDKINVTSDIIVNAKWKNTIDYDAPHGFTKQPSDASEVLGIQIKYYVDNFTIDPSITYNSVVAQIYNPETGEWVTEYNGAHAGNGIVEAYGQQYILFTSQNAGTFTFRLYARQDSTNVAISEAFTVTWAAKQFTTQPQGDMVVAGDTVTVTADKNCYIAKYEIEYNDGGVWKLYQEVDATGKEWDAFSFDFTSDVAKSLTFRINAYGENDELIDTSEEFTITWTSNEHVHAYGAIPNGKDETNHWKECTDPACPDKAHSKIEVEAHKAIGGNCQTEAACACGQMLLGNHIMSNEWTWEGDQHFHKCTVPGCTHTDEKVNCSGSTATCTEKAVCATCGEEYGELSAHNYNTVNGYKKADGHANTCSCGAHDAPVAHTPDRAEATETDPIKCTVCDYILTPVKGHTHSPKAEWSSDEDTHWHECTGCEEQQLDKAAHADEDSDGTCDACAYQMSTESGDSQNPEDTNTSDDTNTLEDTNTPDDDTTPLDDPATSRGGLIGWIVGGAAGAVAIVAICVVGVAVVGVGVFALIWFVIKKKSFADLVAVFKKK